MKKITYALLGAVVLLLVIGVMVLLVPEQTKTKVSIGYRDHIGYLPYYVAMEKGYFTEQGLEINPVVFANTNQMISAVASNNVQATIGGANLQTVYGAEEQSPGSLKVFGTLEAAKGSMFNCILVKKDSSINDISELNGKKVGAQPGSFPPLYIDATLNTVNLTKKDIEIVELDPSLQLSALESGQIDALVAIEPVCTFGINKGSARIIYNDPISNLAVTFASSVLNADFASKNPETAAKIVKASDKAIDFMRQNPQESLDIAAKYANYDPALMKGMKTPVFSKSTEIKAQNMQILADKLYASGVMKTKVDAKNLIYNG